MDERMRFVIRRKDGESMAGLCREFGISRKTGYKIYEHEQSGLEGLTDRTRRPFRYASQLPEPVEAAIVAAKREKPHWGARKIRERLLRSLPHAIKVPAASTVHAVLDRHGLVTHPRRSRTRSEGTPLSEVLRPNDPWCTDYKGASRPGRAGLPAGVPRCRSSGRVNGALCRRIQCGRPRSPTSMRRRARSSRRSSSTARGRRRRLASKLSNRAEERLARVRREEIQATRGNAAAILEVAALHATADRIRKQHERPRSVYPKR